MMRKLEGSVNDQVNVWMCVRVLAANAPVFQGEEVPLKRQAQKWKSAQVMLLCEATATAR